MSGQLVTRMLAGLSLLCLVAIGVLWASGVAMAQEAKCAPRAQWSKMLSEKYHELPIALGMVSDTVLLETFASIKGTWTMLFTNNQGMSCLVAAGDNWQFDTAAFDKAKKGEEF